MPDILLTHPRTFRELKFGREALQALESLGSVVLNDSEELLTPAEVIRAAAGCRVIVADRLTPGTRELFTALPELVAFVRHAVDIRNVDIDAATECGVLVTNAGAHFVDAMVELIVAQMIDLSRSLAHYSREYGAGRLPEARMGTQLAGKTVGIVGMGRVGRRLAEVLRTMRLEVLGHDPEAEGFEHAARVELDALLARSHFVVCLARHSPENTGLCNAAFFSGMRRDAWFVNASRGALVDENALYDALVGGVIAGAALDVGSDVDDLPPLRLASLPNVIAAPHIGGVVHENIVGQAMDSVRQAGDVLAGRLPEHALNAAGAFRFAARK
jgi:D-3-phosphoglycerate dehydrogenase